MPLNLKTLLSNHFKKNIFPKTILSQHAFHSISFLFHTSHENIFGFIGKNQLSGTLPTPYDSGARAAFFVEVSMLLSLRSYAIMTRSLNSVRKSYYVGM